MRLSCPALGTVQRDDPARRHADELQRTGGVPLDPFPVGRPQPAAAELGDGIGGVGVDDAAQLRRAVGHGREDDRPDARDDPRDDVVSFGANSRTTSTRFASAALGPYSKTLLMVCAHAPPSRARA
jgi:hypothetical protein